MVELHAATVLDKPLGDKPARVRPVGGLGRNRPVRPTPVQSAWLKRGLAQPGDKLPLFVLVLVTPRVPEVIELDELRVLHRSRATAH